MVQVAHEPSPRRRAVPSGELLCHDPVPTERARCHRPAEPGRVRQRRLCQVTRPAPSPEWDDVAMVKAAHAPISHRHTIPSGDLSCYDPVPTERARAGIDPRSAGVSVDGVSTTPVTSVVRDPRALVDQADGARGTRTMGVDAAARTARGGRGSGGQASAAAVR